jgi:hypothetical protein
MNISFQMKGDSVSASSQRALSDPQGTVCFLVAAIRFTRDGTKRCSGRHAATA